MVSYREKMVYLDNIRVDSSHSICPIALPDDNVPVQPTFICKSLNTMVIINVLFIIISDIITDIR